MNVMMELRKICCHPYLFDGAQPPPDAAPDAKAMGEASGKLQLLGPMLARLKEGGHRVLIYSQAAAQSPRPQAPGPAQRPALSLARRSRRRLHR